MRVQRIVGLVVLCFILARGREGWGVGEESPAEPSLPNNPQSPTDFQAPANPVSGGDQSDQSSDTDETVAKPVGSGSIEGRGDMASDGEVAALGGKGSGSRVITPQGDIPELHVVKPGDTLSNLCKRYYGDAYVWPKLWAANPAITNPHWIYPGNEVRLIGGRRGGSGIQISGRRMSQDGGVIKLRQYAFVDVKDLQQSGFIAGSDSERAMLSLDDEVYLKGAGGFQPQVGGTYSIYRPHQELKDMDGKVLGMIVEVMGSARVKRLQQNNVGVAVLTESYNVIEREQRVGPLKRIYKRLPDRPTRDGIEAQIIGTLRDGKHFANDELVFFNKGRAQGIEIGYRLHVVRRGDGLRKLIQDDVKDNSEFPWEQVADVAVLEVKDSSSVGVVLNARKEIRRGDRLRSRL